MVNGYGVLHVHSVGESTMQWCMHESWGITCVMWKDKKLVLLLLTHASPTKLLAIQYPVSVPYCDGEAWNDIITSPMHHKYTTHMRGVDVAN